jgi:hypothetical protein
MRKKSLTTIDQARAIVESLKTVNPAIVDLPKVCDEILGFIDEREHEVTLTEKLDGFATDILLITETAKSSLHEIKIVKDSVDKRIQQLDFMEAKYHGLIDHINSVLSELETVLKRL